MLNPYLSVIIPAYNEEKRIIGTLDRILEFFGEKNYTYEIVVVDDGSNDGTVDVVKSYMEKHEHIKLLRQVVNRGKAVCIQAGVMQAVGRYILFTDADLSTPIEEIDRLMAALHDQQASIAIGSRALKDSRVEVHQPFYREFLGKSFNLLVQLLAVPGVWDTQCGFKLFEWEAGREVFSRMTVTDFSFDVEILSIARSRGYKIVEIPVRWINSPDSRLKVTRDVPLMFVGILKTFWNRLTGKYK